MFRDQFSGKGVIITPFYYITPVYYSKVYLNDPEILKI
jgi:hypothetical protein